MPDVGENLDIAKYRQEWWKIAVSALTPIAIAVLTYFISISLNEKQSFLRKEEQILSEKQKTYAKLGEHLNIIFVYVTDVGDFRDYTPQEIMKRKREADRIFYMYRPFWSCGTVSKYFSFMNASFDMYAGGLGRDALIKNDVKEKREAYKIQNKEWNPEWDNLFAKFTDFKVEQAYYDFVSSILDDVARYTINIYQCKFSNST